MENLDGNPKRRHLSRTLTIVHTSMPRSSNNTLKNLKIPHLAILNKHFLSNEPLIQTVTHIHTAHSNFYANRNLRHAPLPFV